LFSLPVVLRKYLKAYLQELGVPFPRTHNLVDLLVVLSIFDSTMHSLRRGLKTLTRYAVEFRYPGFNATKRQAESARRWAERVRRAIRTRLGL
jgi:HEPN domain-containing protein